MNDKKILYILGVVLAFTFCLSSVGWAQPKLEAKAPVITKSYAIDHGRYGTIWKIYIEAEAGDRDMLRVAFVVSQPGWGRYQTDWIYLKPQYQKHLRGYIQWNTFSSKAITLNEWTQITLKVSIFDKAGNESKEVAFPFMFVTGDEVKNEPPAPFDQGEIPKLGNIHVDLKGPDSDGMRVKWEDNYY